MQVEYIKEDHEPSYDNLTTTVKENKKTSKAYAKTQILTRPVFKWTALVVAVTILIIVIVVPTVLEVTIQESIDGNWGNWTSFSDCSHLCGGGSQYRVRNCDEPSLTFGGMWCPGNDTEIQSCNTDPCPVHGGWGNWTSFSECSISCGGGTHTRHRECNSPSPAYGGDHCLGYENETQLCNNNVCPVHGNWGSWTDVSGCSHSCGGGTRYRLRMCNNPSPSFRGKWCPGNATEFNKCSTQTCPDYKSAFTVKHAASGPTSGTITFNSVVSNIGGHYNRSTGQFTCVYPGLYVFDLHIYKDSGENHAACWIRKNGSGQIYASTNPASGSDAGLYEASNSVILHLSAGDKVGLGFCSSVDTMNSWDTSFSGFLLKSD